MTEGAREFLASIVERRPAEARERLAADAALARVVVPASWAPSAGLAGVDG